MARAHSPRGRAGVRRGPEEGLGGASTTAVPWLLPILGKGSGGFALRVTPDSHQGRSRG